MKKQLTKVEGVEKQKKTLNPSADMANGDWLHARRLQLLEKKGDVLATRELTKMENTALFTLK